MKQVLLMIALVGCGTKALTKEESAKVIEAAIRKAAKKPTGELTKADYMEAGEVGYGPIRPVGEETEGVSYFLVASLTA